MIILDTNVVSELMRPKPSDVVMSWIDAQWPTPLYITATTAAELLLGAANLPSGRRKRTVEERVVATIDVDFARRVLPYDRNAATHFADIASRRRRVGRPIDDADAQIAAVCRARSATLATRNGKDFEGTGVELINPWD